jgi:hypothetical protein
MPVRQPTDEGRAGRRSKLAFRLGFAITAMMMFVIAVILPFSVRSVVDDVLGSVVGAVVPITTAPIAPDARNYCRLHLAVVDIAENKLMATLRVAGHCTCRGSCDESYRIVLASVAADDTDAEGMAPSSAITLPAKSGAVSESIDLPIRGHPVRYPFDHYEMVLGVALQRVAPDGSTEAMTPAEAAGHLSMTIQELLPRQTMSSPLHLDPESLRAQDDPIPYVYGFGVSFDRPRYLKLLTVILVLLMAAAAAYAVFMRPLQELIVNSGALVLGVWGVRAVLTPGNLFYLTTIDLALSIVIIFLLGAITVRALMFIHDQADMRLLRRRRKNH